MISSRQLLRQQRSQNGLSSVPCKRLLYMLAAAVIGLAGCFSGATGARGTAEATEQQTVIALSSSTAKPAFTVGPTSVPLAAPTSRATQTPTPTPALSPAAPVPTAPVTGIESIPGSTVLYVQESSLRSSPNRSLFEHPETRCIYPWEDISRLSMYLIGDAPVPSSDGRWLVITDPLPSGPDIQPGTTWLGDLLTGELTWLGRPALAPTWSPDGRRITYVLDETLYVWDVAGEDEPVAIWQREGLLHRYARWSPTGEWIAVADDAKTEDHTNATGMWTYWLVSPDGSEVKELGSWPVGGMGAAPQNLDWSPDGKLLLALPSVVVLTTEGQSTDLAQVYETPPESVPAHLLPVLVGRDKMLDQKRAWLSHGGQQIAYLGHDGICVFDRKSQTDALIATYDVVGQMACRSCLQVRWSADDSLLIAGTRDTAGSRKDAYWGRILALKPEAGSVPELLVEGEDVYLVDVIPDIGGREMSEGAVIDCHSQ